MAFVLACTTLSMAAIALVSIAASIVPAHPSGELSTAAAARTSGRRAGKGMIVRILFTFAGGSGHFEPLVPIARAAEVVGHTVAFAGQAVMISAIEAAGFTAFATAGATLSSAPERLPLLKLDLDREDRDLREGFATRLARKRVVAIIEVCATWQPDL